MNLVFETTYTILPADTNYMTPLVFGGAFFAQLDLCAAQTANRFLHASTTCHAAVTHKAEVVFSKPTYSGDLIFMRGEIVEIGKKSIVVEVTANREKRGKPGRDLAAKARFVFISITDVKDVADRPDLLKYAEHGLLPSTFANPFNYMNDRKYEPTLYDGIAKGFYICNSNLFSSQDVYKLRKQFLEEVQIAIDVLPTLAATYSGNHSNPAFDSVNWRFAGSFPHGPLNEFGDREYYLEFWLELRNSEIRDKILIHDVTFNDTNNVEHVMRHAKMINESFKGVI
jgi:acyl-CoA hydrolase